MERRVVPWESHGTLPASGSGVLVETSLSDSRAWIRCECATGGFRGPQRAPIHRSYSYSNYQCRRRFSILCDIGAATRKPNGNLAIVAALCPDHPARFLARRHRQPGGSENASAIFARLPQWTGPHHTKT